MGAMGETELVAVSSAGVQGLEERRFQHVVVLGIFGWKCPPGCGGEVQGLDRESGQVK